MPPSSNWLALEKVSTSDCESGDLAVITTLPGSKSQEHAQQQGFDLIYTRAILRRAAP